MKNVVRGGFPLLSHLQYAPCRKITSSSQSLEDSIQSAINSKSYTNLPDLLTTTTSQNPNPFSCLSTLTPSHRCHVIDEILQSLLSLRPRSRSHVVYSSLLSFTLHSPSPFPLSLAIIQSTLRAGTSPPSHLLRSLSSAWLQHRENSCSVSSVLLEFESLGYRIDCGTCNYVIESLCYVDQVLEARIVLEGMVKAGCVPDSESYGVLIAALCRLRRGRMAVELIREMVGKIGLSPRERSVVKVLSVLKVNKDVWKAVKLIEYLEEQGCCVGFGAYELVLEGCVHWEEFVLGAKLAVRMVEKGFIPHVKVRHRLVEGLAGAGEWGIACSVRQRFAELNS